MNRTPDEYLAQPYGRLLVREPEGGFSAEILEFPGCIAEGDTAEEAVANVENAARAWIESELEQDHRIPAPASGSDYSGRLLVRLPRGLHRGLALKAAVDNTSLNQEIVAAVACWLGMDDVFHRLAETASRQPSPVAAYAENLSVWHAYQRPYGVEAALRQRSQSQSSEPTELLVPIER